jgi:hypothetical protein
MRDRAVSEYWAILFTRDGGEHVLIRDMFDLAEMREMCHRAKLEGLFFSDEDDGWLWFPPGMIRKIHFQPFGYRNQEAPDDGD